MAEQTVDRIVDFIGVDAKPCETAEQPLLPTNVKNAFSGILPPSVSREAVEHFVRNEWAVHLYDVMIRRSSWRYYHCDHLAVARTVAAWMAEILGWDDDERAEELAAYEQTAATGECVCLPRREPRPHAAQVQTV
jgi:glycerol-3-phosphate dehydrogenase